MDLLADGRDAPDWLESGYWRRLRQLEDEHRRLQDAHEDARRNVERLGNLRSSLQGCPELRDAWSRYCDVVAELDQTTAEITNLRLGT